MENKYYTPSIEEFHIGFRFERKPFSYNVIGESIKEDWLKCTFCKKDGNRAYHCASLVDHSIQTTSLEKEIILKGIDVSNYRVKYLDKEDIEELGWKYHKSIDRLPSFFSKDSFTLDFNSGLVSIYLKTSPFFSRLLFEGKIKNYNELKKVMELIGII